MPGNCGAEVGFGKSHFSIAAASTEQTERVVKTRTCFRLSCHAFGFYNERPG